MNAPDRYVMLPSLYDNLGLQLLFVHAFSSVCFATKAGKQKSKSVNEWKRTFA